ncbi:hypothetical protein [Nonomuraea coxensis]|uniref:hypothetical protein n=1 Tax=Nonomuraea coxensis TaxID=404386 RepID=UPI0012F79240|nr:hypothetical protein [Nonomuraea coxensis]
MGKPVSAYPGSTTSRSSGPSHALEPATRSGAMIGPMGPSSQVSRSSSRAGAAPNRARTGAAPGRSAG